MERERLLRTAAPPRAAAAPRDPGAPHEPVRSRRGCAPGWWPTTCCRPASRSTATACSGARAAAAFEPGIALEGLRGAAVYADAQVPLVERLCVENALDAAAHGAACRTHTRVDGLVLRGRAGRRRALHRRARRARADAARAGRRQHDRAVGRRACAASATPRLALRLGGTRGCHLVLPVWDGAPREALYVAARSDGRPFEICRWRHWMLVGTTDEPFDGDPGRVPVEPWEVDYLLAEVNAEFPRARLGRDDVLFTTGGQRPLLREDGKAPGAITRSHTIADGAAEGLPGLLSAIGGKVTTYRQLAEEVVDRVVAATGRAAARLRHGHRAAARRAGHRGDAGAVAGAHDPRAGPRRRSRRETAEHLVDAYGTRAAAVRRAGGGRARARRRRWPPAGRSSPRRSRRRWRRRARARSRTSSTAARWRA